MAEISNYKVAISPHKSDSDTTRRLMLDVLIALLPCVVCGVVFFGLYALMLVAVCVVTCFVSEQIYNVIRKKPFTFDLSAVVTGVILGLNLPPRAPWYIPVIGGVFAIIFVKMFFGGLGKNFANPAATARVFLLLAYSTLMSQFISADIAENVLSADVTTAPTYLTAGIKAFDGEYMGVSGYWGYVLQLLFGTVGGCIGETCKIAVLAGGVYLTARRVIDWRIPVVYLLTSAVMVLVCYGSASEILLQLLSGGLLFGAVFMATDYATSPKWRYNRVLYAVGLGVITVLIRRFGAYPEGTSLAILIMNIIVPVLDAYILPVRFGQTLKSGKEMPQIMKWAMRGLSVLMALSLVIAAPLVSVREAAQSEYKYVQSVKSENGVYDFNVKGAAYLAEYDYTQPLEYTVTVNSYLGRVTEIAVIQQSTMGYEAELSLFIGKSESEIRASNDLSTDAETSATNTNTVLKNMVLECFEYLSEKTNYKPQYQTIAKVDKTGDLYKFTVKGAAHLIEYDYTQQLEYIVSIDCKTGKVTDIEIVQQSTMGYEAELSFFLGKSESEIRALNDLSTDAETSATNTNAALKDMVLECFGYLGNNTEGAING